MSSLNRDYIHSETDSLILILCLQRNGLTGQDLRHPVRTQGPHKYMTTRSHAKACQTQSGGSRSSEHKHMPYNSKMHDSPHGWIHACSPAITIQSLSLSHTQWALYGLFTAGTMLHFLWAFAFPCPSPTQTTSFTVKQHFSSPQAWQLYSLFNTAAGRW